MIWTELPGYLKFGATIANFFIQNWWLLFVIAGVAFYAAWRKGELHTEIFHQDD